MTQITKQYTFTSGTKADPTQVNSDFDTIYSWANGNIDDQNITSSLINLNVNGYINVKSRTYGAKGDGVTDDTAAINAAINAANSAGGGVVFLPSGTYKVTSITMKSNVWLMGAGKFKTIVQGTQFVIGSYGSFTNVAVTDLYVKGMATTADTFLIYFFNSLPQTVVGSGVYIHNCICENGDSTSIMVVGHSNVEISNCRVINSGENSIEFQSLVSGAATTNIKINDNEVYGWGRERIGGGIAVFGRVDDIAVNGNRINANGQPNPLRGISFDNTNFPTVTIGALGVCNDNLIVGAQIGIQDSTLSRMLFEGNRVYNPTNAGILPGTGSQYIGNFIDGIASNLAFSQSSLILQPEKMILNRVGTTPFLPSTYNYLKNSSFNAFSAGTNAIPDLWSDDAGSVGALAPASVSRSATQAKVGDYALSITAAAGGVSRIRQFFTVSQIQGRFLFASAWVKSATANCAKLRIRTGAGEFESNYAATGGSDFVKVYVAVWVGAADAQASVHLQVDAGKTAEFCGVMASCDNLADYSGDRNLIQTNVLTAVPADAPIEGTIRAFNVATGYTLKIYINGAWRSVTLSGTGTGVAVVSPLYETAKGHFKAQVAAGASVTLGSFWADNGTSGGATIKGIIRQENPNNAQWFTCECFGGYLSAVNSVAFTSHGVPRGAAFLLSTDFTVVPNGTAGLVDVIYKNNVAGPVDVSVNIETVSRF